MHGRGGPGKENSGNDQRRGMIGSAREATQKHGESCPSFPSAIGQLGANVSRSAPTLEIRVEKTLETETGRSVLKETFCLLK